MSSKKDKNLIPKFKGVEKIIYKIKNVGSPNNKQFKEYISQQDVEKIKNLSLEYELDLKEKTGYTANLIKGLMLFLITGLIIVFIKSMITIASNMEIIGEEKATLLIFGLIATLITIITIIIIIVMIVRKNRRNKEIQLAYLKEYLKKVDK